MAKKIDQAKIRQEGYDAGFKSGYSEAKSDFEMKIDEAFDKGLEQGTLEGSKNGLSIGGKQVVNMIVGDKLSPDYYMEGGIETIDYIKAKMTPEQFIGLCLGAAHQYLARANQKEPFDDNIRKAIIYLCWSIGADLRQVK